MERARRILLYIVLLLVAVGSVSLWLNREAVLDWLALRGYTPPARISELATSTAMTDYGERLFFVNHPSLDDKQAFNQNCADIIEEVAVLGCYHGDRLGIYLYDVTDDRLDGVEEVTAAHEMLHQAYDRLDASERARIDALLIDYYRNGLKDQDVRDKLALYELEESELVNEMHSIFGTEIGTLPEELEKYYGQYFTDRSKVVAFHNKSQAAFVEYRSQIASYDKRLADLQQQVDANEATLSQQLADLSSERERLDALLAADNVSEYNSSVPGFNEQVQSYNALLEETQSLIAQYNQLVEERNAVAVQATDLSEALDSRLTPQ